MRYNQNHMKRDHHYVKKFSYAKVRWCKKAETFFMKEIDGIFIDGQQKEIGVHCLQMRLAIRPKCIM